MSLVGADGRALLLRVAREAIRQALDRDHELERDLEHAAADAELREPHAVFVTLKAAGKLRGCIGRLDRDTPLYRNVAAVAPRAALEDPRFAPLAADELDAVRIEITILGESRRLERIEDIVLGRDGVELNKGDAHSVFLPQVAPEQGWDAEELLRQLARKARLADEAWRDAELRVFQGERFGEAP